MDSESRLMEMLSGYAAAHRHPFNIAVHMVGIPVILFGVLVPMTWLSFRLGALEINAAHLVVVGLFLFYLGLDRLFATVFLLFALAVAWLAGVAGDQPLDVAAGIAAAAFIGGYLAQFVGHAVEKTPPVILRHPVQANLAAPFFTVVEAFKLLGLRSELFDRVQERIAHRDTA